MSRSTEVKHEDAKLELAASPDSTDVTIKCQSSIGSTGFVIFQKPFIVTADARSFAWQYYALGVGSDSTFNVPNAITLQVAYKTGKGGAVQGRVPSTPMSVTMGQKWIYTVDSTGVATLNQDLSYKGSDLQVLNNSPKATDFIDVTIFKNGFDLIQIPDNRKGFVATVTLNPQIFVAAVSPGAYQKGDSFACDSISDNVWSFPLVNGIPLKLTYTDANGPQLKDDSKPGVLRLNTTPIGGRGALPSAAAGTSNSTTTTATNTTVANGITTTVTTITTVTR